MPDETGVAPAEGTTAPETTTTETTAEPWAPVLDRVSELASSIDGRFAALEQRFEPEPEPEPDPWAGLFPDQPDEQDEYGQPAQQQPQGLDQQALQAAFQQANAPLMQRLQQLEMGAARQQLLSEIPQLGDPEVAGQTIQHTQQELAGSGLPPDVINALMNNAWAIKTIFKAAEAEKLAAGQAPASEQVPAVESAGGAAPGGNGEQPNIIQQIHSSGWGGLPPGLR